MWPPAVGDGQGTVDPVLDEILWCRREEVAKLASISRWVVLVDHKVRHLGCEQASHLFAKELSDFAGEGLRIEVQEELRRLRVSSFRLGQLELLRIATCRRLAGAAKPVDGQHLLCHCVRARIEWRDVEGEGGLQRQRLHADLAGYVGLQRPAGLERNVRGGIGEHSLRNH